MRWATPLNTGGPYVACVSTTAGEGTAPSTLAISAMARCPCGTKCRVPDGGGSMYFSLALLIALIAGTGRGLPRSTTADTDALFPAVDKTRTMGAACRRSTNVEVGALV